MESRLLVHSLFEAQVQREGERTAIMSPTSWSYSELNSKANAIAQILLERGISNGSLIGIAGARSADGIASILATLKAGSAYVYLDPALPRERVRTIASDSGMACVLVCGEADIPTDVLPILVSNISSSRATNLDLAIHNEAPAVILYTSGSMGSPKGVVLSHRAIVARAADGYTALEGDLQKTSWSLASHLSDTLMPLLHGLGVSIIEDVRDVALFVRSIEQSATSRIVMVPSLLRTMLAAPEHILQGLRSVQTIAVSGEPLTSSLVTRCKDVLPWVTLQNAFGATETCGFVTMGIVTPGEDITVGHELPGWRVDIYDTEMESVPVGEVGEIYVSGPQLASGYWRDPELTAKHFLPSFSASSNRLYRTGDLGRKRADGRVEVIGRLDSQVKVRGYRVNIAEVEAGISSNPAVADAIVIPREWDDGIRLEAYVTLSIAPGDASSLRAYLCETLPGFMIPSGITIIKEMPRLLNGKIDRQRLCRMNDDLSTPSSRLAYGAEGDWDELSRELYRICRSEAGSREFLLAESFLSAGGDSLGGMRVLMQIEERFGVAITLDELFEAPNVRSLGTLVSERLRQRKSDVAPLREFL